MKSSALLELRKLSIGYRMGAHRDRVVASDLNLGLHAGSFVCLLGPNGAGKSTLIRTLTGLQPPLEGEVLLDGTPMASFKPRDLAQRMSLVLTQRVPVGNMPVWSMVAMGRHPYTGWSGRLGTEDVSAVEESIVSVGLEALAFRPVCELSDGERQKAMIARALAQDPKIMILDEATAFLDLPRRVELMDLLRNLARQKQRIILLSSHDLELSLRSADRLWLLSPSGQLRDGVPEDLVLDGGFAETFQSCGLSFDPQRGAFHLDRPSRGQVSLEGEGVANQWTRRALERAGFEISEQGGAALHIRLLTAEGEGLNWEIAGSRSCSGDGVEELLNTLEAVHE
ncbi:ABC transporter ATP-binding protein [Holophaga foetida]|uniref:ABC transporter ATP-binding protein n=1 Tax=Holophaga foetida TaxID=35839 RepID=UPI00024750BF|nr:ABC transporter ATP-binding protein [Holophaga foetida]